MLDLLQLEIKVEVPEIEANPLEGIVWPPYKPSDPKPKK